MIRATLVIFVFLVAQSSHAERSEFIVWNVGQGLWTTLVSESHCRHFDMGGEYAPWKDAEKTCVGKENRIYLSHWDWDHIGFVRYARRRLGRACIAASPAAEAPERKRGLLATLPLCQENDFDFGIKELTPSEKANNSNGSSRVFLFAKNRQPQILLPGDTTRKEERKWALKHSLEKVRILILGHHGSRTSNSFELIRRLRGARMSIASARAARYGHPHFEVARRLKFAGIAVLKTEDWGTLRFEIGPDVTDGRGDIPCSDCSQPAHKLRVRRKHSDL